MLIKGFRFGMMLQFAIGPIALFVFNQSVQYGVGSGLWSTVAVTLADGFYIVLAINGIGSILHRSEKVKNHLLVIGNIILVLFGIKMMIGPLQSLMTGQVEVIVDMVTIQSNRSAFFYAMILTLSSPLTIIFWGGVFAGRMAENDYIKSSNYIFGFGAALSTLIFQGLIAVFAGHADSFLSATSIKLINILIGLILVYLGLMKGFKNKSTKS